MLTSFPRRVAAGLATLLMLAAAPAVGGDEPLWHAASGPAQVQLLELYTSEGCSSCPPADRWLSARTGDPGLWVSFVPVAFHVTYWDGLGWADRFAQPDFDRRQRRVARLAGSGVYTPGVFLNGRAWQAWRRAGRLEPAQPAAAGTLQVALRADGTMAVTFAPTVPAQGLTVRWAWLLHERRTDVLRGENRGRALRHDFVAQQLEQAPLGLTGAVWRAEIATDQALRDGSQGLAVWVEDADGRPVQATGGWL